MQLIVRWSFCLIVVLSAAVAFPRGFCPSTTGRWGYGPSRSVASYGGNVFFGSGIYLQVAEIGPGAEVEILAELELPDIINDMEIRNGIATIASGDSGLVTVDVSDPTSPVLVGKVDTPFNAVRLALSGDVALVADQWGGLRIIDIADPSEPRELSSMDFGEAILEVAAIDDYAYVPVYHTVQIIDISRPLHPRIVSTLDVPTVVNAITIHEDRAYMATAFVGLQIYDFGNPTEPVWLGEYHPLETDYSTVVVHEGHAYVGSTYVRAVDVSDPTNTVPTSDLYFDSALNSIRSLVMHGNLLLAAAEGDGLRVIDTGSGMELNQVGWHDVPGAGEQLTIAGTTLYLGSWDEYGDGIRVFGIDSPSDPVLVGATHELPFGRYVSDLAVTESTLYLGAFLAAVDVSDPAAPQGTAYIGDYLIHVEAVPGYLLAATGNPWEPNELRVYDLSEPWAPVLVGSAPVSGIASGLDVEGDRAYVVSWDQVPDTPGVLSVIDLSNKEQPTLIGSLETSGIPVAVSVENSIAYVADQQHLRIIDASTPFSPRQLARIRLDSEWPHAIDVAVSDGVVLVADWGGWYHEQFVHIYDAADPSDPRLRSRLRIEAADIEAAGGLFYIADQFGGYRIIDPNTRCPEPYRREIPPPQVD